MSCAETLPVNKFKNNPILKGFPWRDQFTFATGTLAAPVYLDLDLYDIYFAIAPSLTSTNIVSPTITTYDDGLATFEFSDTQTAAMSAGTWVGHSFLSLISDPVPTFKIQLEILVIDPVVSP
jgi:hypothetical protein